MPTRVLVVADSDSYVKWGAALAETMPEDWQRELVVLDSDRAPSDRQVSHAVESTRFASARIRRVDAAALRRGLRDTDVLLLAVRAHAVPGIVDWLRAMPRRPVVVTGPAGVALPVQWYDVNLRRGADLFIAHSRTECTELATLAAQRGVPLSPALATLPFLARVRQPATSAGRPDRTIGPLVFAPQALIPAFDADRSRLLGRLGDAARAMPERTVIIKVRASAGEQETHRGASSYASLAEGLDLPGNVVFAEGPMAVYLRDASGLVTVSSSAALESAAAGVPAVVLTDFGLDDATMTSVFSGSGLLGTLDDVVAGRFGQLDPIWAVANYFHDPAEDTWLAQLETMVEHRDLPIPAAVPKTWGNRVRGIYYRHDALRPWHRTPLAPLERLMLWAAHRLNRRVLHLT